MISVKSVSTWLEEDNAGTLAFPSSQTPLPSLHHSNFFTYNISLTSSVTCFGVNGWIEWGAWGNQLSTQLPIDIFRDVYLFFLPSLLTSLQYSFLTQMNWKRENLWGGPRPGR